MYLSGHFNQNDAYMAIAENQAKADKLYWETSYPDTNANGLFWGLGAGAGPHGYVVDKIDESALPNLYSPHIVAGWLPIMKQEALSTLEHLWNTKDNSKVALDNGDPSKGYILWKGGSLSSDPSYSNF